MEIKAVAPNRGLLKPVVAACRTLYEPCPNLAFSSLACSSTNLMPTLPFLNFDLTRVGTTGLAPKGGRRVRIAQVLVAALSPR